MSIYTWIDHSEKQRRQILEAIDLFREKDTRDDLLAGGATQLGTASDDYAPCTDDGQNCANDIYAVSLPSEIPAAFITWFQAQEACANAGKRLPTNAEWQVGANGTPDPGPDDHATTCNTANTGCDDAHRLAQRLRVGAWGLRHGGQRGRVGGRLGAALDGCPGWGSFSDDFMCLAGPSDERGRSRGAAARRLLPRRCLERPARGHRHRCANPLAGHLRLSLCPLAAACRDA